MSNEIAYNLSTTPSITTDNFDEINANDDNKITKPEFEEYLNNEGVIGEDRKLALQRFDEMAGKDGFVIKSEAEESFDISDVLSKLLTDSFLMDGVANMPGAVEYEFGASPSTVMPPKSK